MSVSDHVQIDPIDLHTAAFWLGQLARWLDDPNHASQFSWDLFGEPENYQSPLTVVIRNVAAPLHAALNPGPNQTVTPGPNELDTSSWAADCSSQRQHSSRRSAHRKFGTSGRQLTS